MHDGRFADVAQLVERNLAKVEVAGSIPVVRSKTPVYQGFCSTECWRSTPRKGGVTPSSACSFNANPAGLNKDGP